MQARAAHLSSMIIKKCLAYSLSSVASPASAGVTSPAASITSPCSSNHTSSSLPDFHKKLMARVIIADVWNALSQQAKPSIPLSMHPKNPFSKKFEEYMHHFYAISCLLHRIMLFDKSTTNEERLRVEYEMWLFPVDLSQKYMWISSMFASNDSASLHICFWTLILLYYTPQIGRPRMGLHPSMGLLLPLQHFGNNIITVMFEFRRSFWDWQVARGALHRCVENFCELEIKYESDEAVRVLKDFIRRAKSSSVFPSLSLAKEFLPLIAKAEQCDRPVVPQDYDKATVVWMFRDLRVMSISMVI